MIKINRSFMVVSLAALCLAASSSAWAATTFKTTRNGALITCGLINGTYIPGSGSGNKFVSTQSAISKLAKKKDAKSKARVAKLKAYLKLAAPICKKGPNTKPTPTPTPTTPGGPSVAAGQQVFNSKCASCHAAAAFKGKTAAQLQNVSGMPSLTSQEAADLAAFVNQ
jgi:cytochrome c